MLHKDTTPAEKLDAGDLRPGGNAMMALLSYVERIERLTEESEGIAEDRKEVYAEVKAHGFDTKTLRKVIARRKLDATSRAEADSLMELYEEALAEAAKRQTQQSIEDGE